MSEFVEVEWFGRAQKVGIVLTYDKFDGFKGRMAPLPTFLENAGEMLGTQWVMDNAAKIPFEWAWGIFGQRMVTEWQHRHSGEICYRVRYDHRDYDVETLKETES